MTVTGAVDVPARSEGNVIDVSGWVDFDGRPAVRIEVYAEDQVPQAARIGLPRADLAPDLGQAGALAAGYEARIVLRVPAGAAREISVWARAFGPSGEIWMSRPARALVRGPSVASAVISDPVWTVRYGAAAQQRAGSRPRIAQLVVFAHSLAIGGAEWWLHDLLIELAGSDSVQIRVVAPRPGPMRELFEANGIAVHISGEYPVEPRRYAGHRSEMAALLALWSADIVLVNILGVFGPADAAQMMGVPVVWAVHESYALDAFARVSVGQSGVAAEVRERWLGALANSELIFVSTATADLLRAELEGSRARVLRYGVDVAGIERFVQSHDRAAMRAELGYGAEDLVLLSIGVMGSRKGVLQLISAFQSVATAYPRAHLVLVGADEDDAYTAAVLTFVEALGLGDRVRVVPLTTDTYPWYFVCDLLVSASDNESLPRSMIEALAFSRPIAAAEVFGVGELVKSGATGWLFAPNDRDSLATALKLALSAPAEELALMGAQAHDKAADFHSEELVGEIRRLIDGACRACDVRVL